MNKVKSTIVAGIAFAGIGLGATAQASSLGDYVNYGRIPINSSISCSSVNNGCYFDVRDTSTYKTTRVWVTLNARMYYCESAGVSTFAYVNYLNLNRVMVAQNMLSVIWTPRYPYNTKPGAVTCKD